MESEEALAWVRAHNEPTIAGLESDPLFPVLYEQAEAIYNATDRIPTGNHRGGWFYNFWQDADHVRGLWRRCTLESYRTDDPEWDVLLDIDALAEAEGENWVLKGVDPLEPDFDRALVQLSRGGKDAMVIREFDVPSKQWVEGGFELPEAKTRAEWEDRNTLLVATNFGEGSLTTSGYPRIVKRWKRGTPLEDAEILFEGETEDVSVTSWVSKREDTPLTAVVRGLSFFEYEVWLVDGDELRLLPVPASAMPQSTFAGRLLFSAREDWERPGEEAIETGTLFGVDVAQFLEEGELPAPEILFQPDDHTTILVESGDPGVNTSRSAVWITLLRDVRGRALAHVPRPRVGVDYGEGSPCPRTERCPSPRPTISTTRSSPTTRTS